MRARQRRRPFPSVWRLSLLRSCSARPRHYKDVLWHSTEVGNTRSPWAPPAPDLNHSRSQWPSACLPSCQAALSQTRCKHADNKFRKHSGERRRKKQRVREIKKKTKMEKNIKKSLKRKKNDRIREGEPDAQVTGNPPNPPRSEKKNWKRGNEKGEGVRFFPHLISIFSI